jgi:hypothetical protein
MSADAALDDVRREAHWFEPTGECTRIRFRSAPLPEMLDGLAPGQLPNL